MLMGEMCVCFSFALQAAVAVERDKNVLCHIAMQLRSAENIFMDGSAGSSLLECTRV